MRTIIHVKRLKATLVALSLAGAAAGAMAVVPARPAAAAGPPVFLVGDSVMQVFRFSYGKPGLAEVEKGYRSISTRTSAGVSSRSDADPARARSR